MKRGFSPDKRQIQHSFSYKKYTQMFSVVQAIAKTNDFFLNNSDNETYIKWKGKKNKSHRIYQISYMNIYRSKF